MVNHTQSLSIAATTVLDDVSYYIRSQVEHFLTAKDLPAVTTPAVVIHAEGSEAFSSRSIEDKLMKFHLLDDVYSPAFAKEGLIVLVHEGNPPSIHHGSEGGLEHGGKVILQKVDDVSTLPEGPYFIQGKKLHQAWRLYTDELGAFTSAISPDGLESKRSQPLVASADDGIHQAVAVPSRLYFPPSTLRPLNGIRIAVKDNYHIAGMITTHGNRSYARCYGKQNETSDLVEEVVRLGAIIVGKTKLSSFAGNEVPPNGPIDYLAPFNPRADGYQNPTGSSMGPAAAIAGYPWLDCSFATDTTGSTRSPASANGIWGLRTTWGSMSMKGIIPSARNFDTVGLMARSPDSLLNLLSHTLSQNPSKAEELPRVLLYPTDWLPAKNEGHQRIIEALVQRLESFLGITRTEVSLSKKWSETAPEDLRGISLADYLKKTGYNINMYDGYHNFAEFRELHQQKFNEPPYISPVQRKKWNSGSQIIPEQRAEAVEHAEVFKDWVSQQVFTQDPVTIMVTGVGNPEPNYRDESPPPAASGPGGSYNPNFVPTILGVPQLVVPAGQLPFQSRVTNRTEYVPACAGLIGAPGADEMLLRVARDVLKSAGWPSEVLTGRLMFLVGDNECHSTKADVEAAKL